MNYRQDSKVTVIVRGEGVSGEEAKEPKGAKTADTDEETPKGFWAKATGTTNKMKQRRIVVTNTTHLLATTRQIWLLGVNYDLTGIGYRSGDQAYQEQTQRDFEILNEIGSIASSTAMGLVYGSRGGPLGAVVGTVTGLASGVFSTWAKYATKKREYTYQVFKQNTAIEYQRARANLNLSTGRLR